jgi:hypothetical protein
MKKFETVVAHSFAIEPDSDKALGLHVSPYPTASQTATTERVITTAGGAER